MLKIMLTAIAVGSIGVYALVQGNLASLSVKPLVYSGIVIGGVLFGVGMAIFGLCPGTSVAACGEGNRHAMVGVLGMFLGAALFVAAYPLVQPLIQGLGDAGKLTIPEWLQISPGLAIAGLLLVIMVVLTSVEYVERRTPRETAGASSIPDLPSGPHDTAVR